MRAWLSLRESLHYRRDAFTAGLSALGYRVEHRVPDRFGPDDVFVCWNRYGAADQCAQRFEQAGRPVVVAENGYLGNEFAGARWYALARTQHNGMGWWPVGGPERWDSLKVDLAPWRDGEEIVILPQRGIGPSGVAMPRDWAEGIKLKLAEKGITSRIRPHPGTGPAKDLEQDLANAKCVVTWGSGAAIKALLYGVPVFHGLSGWIGAESARPVSQWALGLYREDASRLNMLRKLIWAQATLAEISSGEAFRRLLV